MKYFIIIRGPLGVGKSTISKKLAKKLHANYVSIDSILEENNMDKATKRHIPLKNFLKANNLSISRFKEKKKIVFDGNFYLKNQIRHLVRNLKTRHYIFTLKAPLEVCIKRDRNRKGAYGKDATVAVYNLVTKFDYGTVINTDKKTSSEVVREIMKYLPKY